MALQEGDFVSLDYTATNLENNEVFDTTDKNVAQERGIYNPKAPFEPITICIGERHVLTGLDKALIGKKENDTFEITLDAEDAFGKKDPKSIKLMPKKLFIKEKINPQPGLDVNIDGVRGVIRSISGNRVIVDFNHALAGRRIKYNITTHGRVADVQEQVKSIVSNALRFEPKVDIDKAEATVHIPFEFPDELKKQLSERIIARTDCTSVNYKVNKSQPDA